GTTNRPPPSPARTNAIDEPSGDHAGSPSPARSVSFLVRPSVTSTTSMPPDCAMAILEPSGDHANGTPSDPSAAPETRGPTATPVASTVDRVPVGPSIRSTSDIVPSDPGRRKATARPLGRPTSA